MFGRVPSLLTGSGGFLPGLRARTSLPIARSR